MHPSLFKIGPFELHSYGFMLALSFFFGILLASRRAPARGVRSEVVFDTALVVVFASIFGARLLYVLFHLDEMHAFIDWIAVWRGGLSMYGGVLAAMAATYFYLKKHHVPFLRMADIMAPSLALGLMLTRVGCFLNGCCYGRPTTSVLGVHFPEGSFLERMYQGMPLHPAQLYSSFTGLLILLVLLWWDRRRVPEGQLFGIFLLLDATGRFILDFFRFYEANVYVVAGLTINQVICIGLFGLGLVLLFVQRHASPATAARERDGGGEKIRAAKSVAASGSR